MDPNRFNEEVRAHLIEIPIGKQGVAFDRLDLDAWVDRNGRPGKTIGGKPSWKVPPALTKGGEILGSVAIHPVRKVSPAKTPDQGRINGAPSRSEVVSSCGFGVSVSRTFPCIGGVTCTVAKNC